MGKFQFRFERVLTVKKIRERESELEWATAHRETERQLEQERNLLTTQAEHVARRSESGGVGWMKLEAELAQGLRRQIKMQRGRIVQAKANEDLAQAKMFTAIKERKAMERLRERKCEEFIIEENRGELRTANEMASRRYIDRLMATEGR